MKTVPTDASVDTFLDGLPDERRRADARTVCGWMAELTGEPATMWGTSIVGFGRRTLQYDSGRELEWFVVGLSPRKAALVLYLGEEALARADLLGQLGKHELGKGCLYVKRVADVDEAALRALITASTARRSA